MSDDWDEFQRFLFDEHRFPMVVIVAGVIVVLSVMGTAFGF